MADLKDLLDQALPEVRLDADQINTRLRQVVRQRRPRRLRAAAVLAGPVAAVIVVATLLLTATPAGAPAREVDISLGGTPIQSVAVRGSIWVLTCTVGCSDQSTSSQGELVQVAETTGRVVSRTPVENPVAFAVGPNSAWTLDFRAGTVSRVEISTGRVTAKTQLVLPKPIVMGDRRFLPESVAIGGSSVWVATNRGWLAQLASSSGRLERMVRLPRFAPGEVVFSGSAAWVALGPLGLARVDALSGETKLIGIRAGRGGRVATEQLTVGDGSVWSYGEVAGATSGGYVLAGKGRIVRVDARTNRTLTKTAVAAGPVNIAYGDGALWVANFASGRIARIDPRTPRSIDEFTTNGPGTLVAASAGAVWATTRHGTLRRIPVRVLSPATRTR